LVVALLHRESINTLRKLYLDEFRRDHRGVRGNPGNDRWFVEAVIAWGRGEIIRSELRLLPVAS